MCFTPIQIRNSKTGGIETVPCGDCQKCKLRRASHWSFRLMQEEKVSSSAYFLTLTYGDICRVTRNGFLTIVKRDIQLFFKRLRKAHTRGYPVRGIRYYAVGEYGGRYYRPHYHIILFNAELEVLIGKKDAQMVKRGIIDLDGKFPYYCPAWSDVKTGQPIGHITIGRVSEASVGYTMKYISKPSRIPLHKNDDRVPEFGLQSKGLGESYLTPAMIRWHKVDLENRMYCGLKDGKKIGMPRYYKLKIYNDQEKKTAGDATKVRVLLQENRDKIMFARKGKNINRYRFESKMAAHSAAVKNQFQNSKF